MLKTIVVHDPMLYYDFSLRSSLQLQGYHENVVIFFSFCLIHMISLHNSHKRIKSQLDHFVVRLSVGGSYL